MKNTPPTSSAEMVEGTIPVENAEAIQVLQEAIRRTEELMAEEAAIHAEAQEKIGEILARSDASEMSHELAA
jgi:hypothetical protein